MRPLAVLLSISLGPTADPFPDPDFPDGVEEEGETDGELVPAPEEPPPDPTKCRRAGDEVDCPVRIGPSDCVTPTGETEPCSSWAWPGGAPPAMAVRDEPRPVEPVKTEAAPLAPRRSTSVSYEREREKVRAEIEAWERERRTGLALLGTGAGLAGLGGILLILGAGGGSGGPNCTTGKRCGGTCIEVADTCHIAPDSTPPSRGLLIGGGVLAAAGLATARGLVLRF